MMKNDCEIKLNFFGDYIRIETIDCLLIVKGNNKFEIKKEDNGKPIILIEAKQQ